MLPVINDVLICVTVSGDKWRDVSNLSHYIPQKERKTGKCEIPRHNLIIFRRIFLETGSLKNENIGSFQGRSAYRASR